MDAQIILDDAEQLIEHARSQPDFNAKLPTFIAGLSQGGGIAAHISLRAQTMKGLKFTGSVWCAPCLIPMDPTAIGTSQAIWDFIVWLGRHLPKARCTLSQISRATSQSVVLHSLQLRMPQLDTFKHTEHGQREFQRMHANTEWMPYYLKVKSSHD
jgi:alpha-beta hydrolase superfamily lysophospholipase